MAKKTNELKKVRRFLSTKWTNEFADAFYDEDYSKMSKMLGKKITSQIQAEEELDKFKDRMVKKYRKLKKVV